MDFKYQKRMAADLMKCGVNRVKLDPDRLEDIAEAITRADVRTMINAGAIYAAQKKGISKGRKNYAAAQKKKGRRRGPGSRKGAKFARTPRKQAWMKKIRPIRAYLKELRNDGKIEKNIYRKLYRQAKGGMFKSKAHLETQMKIHNYIKED